MVAVPPITCQSHPLPSSHGGDQGGLQSHPGSDGAGWEHLLPTAPRPGCGFGCALPTLLRGQGDMDRTPADVGVHTCGTNTHCQGWWRAQHPVPALHPTNSHSSRLRERGTGSGSQRAAGHGGAKLIPIHHPYQAALAARRSLAAGPHGQQAGAIAERQAGASRR